MRARILATIRIILRPQKTNLHQDTQPRTNLRRRGCSLVRKVKEIGASLRDGKHIVLLKMAYLSCKKGRVGKCATKYTASLLCAAVGSVKHASEQGLQHDPYIFQ
ncbi:hypothetical protein O6P43_006418 [Quillaja saponaria]|uniref:Uncharacterized protein n=1 Tax=Quillaja saponaria TaxID=32244 RepID=A0AAD7Q8E6_QUISA|nr:hypothetical protein O6P43_006418 [Quillaja saponaria]